MDYKLCYGKLVAKARVENRKKHKLKDPCYVYYERHHIVPSCLGGSDDKSNLVLLTAREHFVAHWLLTKLTSGQDYYKCLEALAAFLRNKKGRKLSSRQMEKARKANAVAASNRWASSNPSQKPENRVANSKRMTERNLSDNPGKSDKNRAANSKRMTERNSTEQSRETNSSRLKILNKTDNPSKKPENREASRLRLTERMSKPENKAKAAATQRVVHVCPWCNKTGQGNGFIGWHFSNCLEHIDNKGLTRSQIKFLQHCKEQQHD